MATTKSTQDKRTINTMSTADARDHFSELINRAAFGKERIILTRRGKPLAAVLPVEILEVLEAVLEDMADREDAIRAREEIEQEGTIPWVSLKADLGLD